MIILNTIKKLKINWGMVFCSKFYFDNDQLKFKNFIGQTFTQTLKLIYGIVSFIFEASGIKSISKVFNFFKNCLAYFQTHNYGYLINTNTLISSPPILKLRF